MCNSFFVGERRYLESMPVTPSLRSRAGSEPIRFAQGKLREGSGSTGGEILRFAQDDSPDPSPVRFREAFSPNISVSAISRKSSDICRCALTGWGRGILNHWSDPAFCQWNGSCYGQARSGRKGGWNSEEKELHQPRCATRGRENH